MNAYSFIRFRNRFSDAECFGEKGEKMKHTQTPSLASSEIATFFKVLSDEGRIKILRALLEGKLCVKHLCEAVDMEQSAVSHSLQVLKKANLVKSTRAEKNMVYSIADEHVRLILDMAILHIGEDR